MAVRPGNPAFSAIGLGWLSLVFTIIACTMQAQDMYNQEGDRLRNRRSFPLVFGDRAARYSIVFPVAIWSVLAPAYWSQGVISFVPTTSIGCVIIVRLLRNVRSCTTSDRTTFVYWNAWIMCIYLLPLWVQHPHLQGTINQ